MSTGYACPVCDAPQADIGHLANHLAFTAMLRDDGHGDWLDERVPDWADRGEADLAAELGEHADDLEKQDYPQVFEDTTDADGEAPGRDAPAERSGALFDDGGSHQHGGGHDHQHGQGHANDHGHQHGSGHDHGPADATGGPDVPAGVDTDLPGGELDSDEHEAIMEEARELTRELREGGDGAETGDGDATDGEAETSAGGTSDDGATDDG
jgi:hypothetical protein